MRGTPGIAAKVFARGRAGQGERRGDRAGLVGVQHLLRGRREGPRRRRAGAPQGRGLRSVRVFAPALRRQPRRRVRRPRRRARRPGRRRDGAPHAKRRASGSSPSPGTAGRLPRDARKNTAGVAAAAVLEEFAGRGRCGPRDLAREGAPAFERPRLFGRVGRGRGVRGRAPPRDPRQAVAPPRHARWPSTRPTAGGTATTPSRRSSAASSSCRRATPAARSPRSPFARRPLSGSSSSTRTSRSRRARRAGSSRSGCRSRRTSRMPQPSRASSPRSPPATSGRRAASSGRTGSWRQVRAPLVRGYAAVRSAMEAAGAFGVALAGAGPSLMAVAPAGPVATRVARAAEAAFRREGVAARAAVHRIDRRGARRVPPPRGGK